MDDLLNDQAPMGIAPMSSQTLEKCFGLVMAICLSGQSEFLVPIWMTYTQDSTWLEAMSDSY